MGSAEPLRPGSAAERPDAPRGAGPPSGVLAELLVCENTIGRLPPRLRVFWLLSCLALIGLFALLARGAGPAFTGTAVSVVDGGTIRLRMGELIEEVRYIGLSAPEQSGPASAAAAGGWQATEANRGLVEGKRVRLELDVRLRDESGRLLAYVWVEEAGGAELMANAELIRLGHAQALAAAPNLRHRALLRDLEREARQASRGRWANRRRTWCPRGDSNTRHAV
jgi:endonuclease YncB( thermonuclease family)